MTLRGSNGNPITVIPRMKLQYTLWWVDFSFGPHPAVVMTNDTMIDGNSNVMVCPLTSTPPKGKTYEVNWVAISTEPGRLSYFKPDNTHMVRQSSLRSFIGYLSDEDTKIIFDRFMSSISGEYLPRLVDDIDEVRIEKDTEVVITTNDDCVSSDDIASDIETGETTEIIITADEDCAISDDTTPINEVTDLTATMLSFDNIIDMVTDPNLSTDIVEYMVREKYTRVGSVTNDRLSLLLIAMIRDSEFRVIEKKRFTDKLNRLLNKMVERSLIGRDTAVRISMGELF